VEGDWVQARFNRPLWTGDRLWTDRGARAELQIGGAALFASPESSLAVLTYDDDRAQFEITQGTVEIFVRSLGRNDTIEIDTPNLAFVVRVPGRYRIDVRNDGESTGVTVLRGEGEAFGTRTAYMLRAGQGYRFYGADLADYDAEPLHVAGAFDSWVDGRVRYYERSQSARYVSTDMVGYADLDAYGTWRNVANYGAVWVPTRVDAGWAPYRYGHWSWVEPWGWTWIDDAPWGFAPFHYGRWAYVDNRYWAWVPGPRNAAPVYAPALVAFVGGASFSASVSSGPGVAWFPLAPGEVYRPGYNASREYFTRRERHQHGREREQRHQRLQQPAHGSALREHQQHQRGDRRSDAGVRAVAARATRGRANEPGCIAGNAGRRGRACRASESKRGRRSAARTGETRPAHRRSQSGSEGSAAARAAVGRAPPGSDEAAAGQAGRSRGCREGCAAPAERDRGAGRARSTADSCSAAGRARQGSRA
jgi:hypothetical protein